MPALTCLAFKQTRVVTLPASDSLLVFSNLRELTLHSPFLDRILRLLSYIRLPSITNFTAVIGGYPTEKELSSFFPTVQTCNAGCAIEGLTLDQSFPMHNIPGCIRNTHLFLNLERLQPYTTFSNLRCFSFNVRWSVNLTDHDLLTLVSAWAHLEYLSIGAANDWNPQSTQSGITPDGLIQLLQTRLSLRHVALHMDTRGYTKPPPLGWLASPGWTVPRRLSINVLNSLVDAKSLLAVSAFFSDLKACADISFFAWEVGIFNNPDLSAAYRGRWMNVFKGLVNMRSLDDA